MNKIEQFKGFMAQLESTNAPVMEAIKAGFTAIFEADSWDTHLERSVEANSGSDEDEWAFEQATKLYGDHIGFVVVDDSVVPAFEYGYGEPVYVPGERTGSEWIPPTVSGITDAEATLSDGTWMIDGNRVFNDSTEAQAAIN